MADKKPLWRIAEAAWWSTVNTEHPLMLPPENKQWADVFRAIADGAVPEEPEPYYSGLFYSRKEELSWERWKQRMETRALLLKAADEAEGEP